MPHPSCNIMLGQGLGQGLGEAEENLCHLCLLLTLLKQTQRCLQPTKTYMRHWCSSMPQPHAAGCSAGTCHRAACDASVCGVATCAVTACGAGSHGAGACGCKGGHTEQPRKGITEEQAICQRDEWWDKDHSSSGEDEQTKRLGDECSNSISVQPLVIHKAKGTPGVPQHALLVCNFTHPVSKFIKNIQAKEGGEADTLAVASV